MPIREPAQSLADVATEEAARGPASRLSAVPFRVSSSLSAPPQTPVSARPSGPPAPVRSSGPPALVRSPGAPASTCSSTAGVRAHVNDSLFLAGDDEEGGVPMDLSRGPSPRSRARGDASPVRSAATATTAAAAPARSSRGARGVPPASSRAVPIVVDSDDEESVRASVNRARAATPARAVGRVSTSAARASAGAAPAVAALAAASPHPSGRRQSNQQAVDYTTDPREAARQSGSSAEVLVEADEVALATAASVPAPSAAPSPGAGRSRGPAADAAPANDAGATAARGSWHRAAWVPTGHEMPDPNPLSPAEAEGVVLRSNVAERVVRQGPVVSCIRCLERWQQDPTEPCQPARPGAHACLKCSGGRKGCVLVGYPSLFAVWYTS
jgi:hypothetical protein